LVLLLEGLHLSTISFSEGVPLEPAFAGFHEVLQPLVIDVGADAFSAAEDADGYFSADALDENPDFLLRSEAASRDLLGVANQLLSVLVGLIWVVINHPG
jgi:hypothetical protein